ncbi:MAG: substrate-binding domain-containing protein, partial [Opitutales bacterium]|nr:substrate-binding domain-containing protein [Opitutales bacterium]
IAFEKFCRAEKLPHKILRRKVRPEDVKPKTVWIVFDDGDLVEVVKTSNELGLKMKRDYALISYNDIPIKRIICGGITTISIDFFGLGRRVAEQILNWDSARSETVPTFLIRGATL